VNESNLILQTDSYKVSHHLQYPPNTTYVYSYFESRGGKYDNVVFFGLQYVIKRWLAGQVVTEAKIQEVMSVRTYPFLATDTPITYSTQKLVYFIKRHNVLPLPLGLI